MLVHVNEHIAFGYRKEMERMMGVELPPPNEENEDGIPENQSDHLRPLLHVKHNHDA